MKANLIIQYILSVILMFSSIVMMVTAFAKDAATIWKLLTVILVFIHYGLIKQIRKELKS